MTSPTRTSATLHKPFMDHLDGDQRMAAEMQHADKTKDHLGIGASIMENEAAAASQAQPAQATPAPVAAPEVAQPKPPAPPVVDAGSRTLVIWKAVGITAILAAVIAAVAAAVVHQQGQRTTAHWQGQFNAAVEAYNGALVRESNGIAIIAERDAAIAKQVETIAARDAVVAARETAVAEGKTALATMTAERDRLQSIIVERNAAITQVAGERDAAMTQGAAQQKAMADLQSTIRRMEQDQAATASDMQALRVSEAKAKRELDARDNDLALAKRTNASLTEQLKTERAANDVLKAEIARLKQVIAPGAAPAPAPRRPAGTAPTP